MWLFSFLKPSSAGIHGASVSSDTRCRRSSIVVQPDHLVAIALPPLLHLHAGMGLVTQSVSRRDSNSYSSTCSPDATSDQPADSAAANRYGTG